MCKKRKSWVDLRGHCVADDVTFVWSNNSLFRLCTSFWWWRIAMPVIFQSNFCFCVLTIWVFFSKCDCAVSGSSGEIHGFCDCNSFFFSFANSATYCSFGRKCTYSLSLLSLVLHSSQFHLPFYYYSFLCRSNVPTAFLSPRKCFFSVTLRRVCFIHFICLLSCPFFFFRLLCFSITLSCTDDTRCGLRLRRNGLLCSPDPPYVCIVLESLEEFVAWKSPFFFY